jgi:hypothetical protein
MVRIGSVKRSGALSPVSLPLICCLMLLSLFSRKPEPVAQVIRYRGVAAGWQAIGSARSVSDAERLLSLWARIDPAATLRSVSL